MNELEEIIALLERKAAYHEAWAKSAASVKTTIPQSVDTVEARQLRRAADLLREKDALEARIAAAPSGEIERKEVMVGTRGRITFDLPWTSIGRIGRLLMELIDADALIDQLEAERDRLREALNIVAEQEEALRQGGPDPDDLQLLSEALEYAVNTAAEALAQREKK